MLVVHMTEHPMCEACVERGPNLLSSSICLGHPYWRLHGTLTRSFLGF